MSDPSRLTLDLWFLKASAEGIVPVVFVFVLVLLMLAIIVRRHQ